MLDSGERECTALYSSARSPVFRGAHAVLALCDKDSCRRVGTGVRPRHFVARLAGLCARL